MRLYDCEQSAQDDVLDKGKEEEYDFEEENLKNHLKDSNSEIMTVDTDKYFEVYPGVTSPPSLDYPVLSARLSQLIEANGTNDSQPDCRNGTDCRRGEFMCEKKIFLQDKPYTEENVFHMKRKRLGDICWYLAQACMALDTTFDEVIEMNVDRTTSTLYPGGSFDVHKSEFFIKEGDL